MRVTRSAVGLGGMLLVLGLGITVYKAYGDGQSQDRG